MDRDVRAGQWPRGLLNQLEGRTFGVISQGNRLQQAFRNVS